MYKSIWKPLLFSLDPETAHDKTLDLAESLQRLPIASTLIGQLVRNADFPELRQSLWDLDFSGPVGIAAGLDKNCRAAAFFSHLGANFIEIGSVTNLPSIGNDKPRLFRLLRDEALINRMGLNNDGPERILKRFDSLKLDSHCVVGFNIAKTNNPALLGAEAVQDMSDCYTKLQNHGAFHVLNVSCPNTEDGRTFESGEGLGALLTQIIAVRKTTAPLLVKLSVDLSPDTFRDAIMICERHNVSGYVISNTTNSRSDLRTPPRSLENIGRGGLSGPPLRERALERIRILRRLVEKPIIGAGGINSGDVAYRFIRAGASLVECYTGLVYEGPGLLARIKRELVVRLKQDGFSDISKLVGADV